MSERYAAGLSATLQGASVPYGYTLTVWCSGQVLSDFRGSPRFWLIALFVTGAATAFVVLHWFTQHTHPELAPGTGGRRPHLTAAVMLQVAAIGSTLGAVALLAQIPSALDWPAGGFAATALYMTGTAAGVTLRGE